MTHAVQTHLALANLADKQVTVTTRHGIQRSGVVQAGTAGGFARVGQALVRIDEIAVVDLH